MMLAPGDTAVLVRRRTVECHRRLLIATNLDDASDALPVVQSVDPLARIVVLVAYRIPFYGLHALLNAQRLERELAACARETMATFVESTGLPAGQFQLLTFRGDLLDHVTREVRSRRPDLVVLALGHHSHRAKRQVERQLLQDTRCDLVIVGRERWRTQHGPTALIPLGPWTC